LVLGLALSFKEGVDMSLQIIYDEIKKLDRKLNSMQNDINILKKEIKEEET
tara:strand:+ start:556 stop:708 length:153 start_codon:yes stop_codon:yes gene_type:complete